MTKEYYENYIRLTLIAIREDVGYGTEKERLEYAVTYINKLSAEYFSDKIIHNEQNSQELTKLIVSEKILKHEFEIHQPNIVNPVERIP